jgi:hypothetical protein
MDADLKDVAALVQAVASLLWPVLVLLTILMFRAELAEVLGQFKRMKRGKLFGQEIELSEVMDKDDSSNLLTAYLFPNGTFSEERLQVLNGLLRDLGVVRDVRLILDGSEAAPLRKQLIRYATEKGYGIDPRTPDQVTGG